MMMMMNFSTCVCVCANDHHDWFVDYREEKKMVQHLHRLSDEEEEEKIPRNHNCWVYERKKMK